MPIPILSVVHTNVSSATVHARIFPRLVIAMILVRAELSQSVIITVLLGEESSSSSLYCVIEYTQMIGDGVRNSANYFGICMGGRPVCASACARMSVRDATRASVRRWCWAVRSV